MASQVNANESVISHIDKDDIDDETVHCCHTCCTVLTDEEFYKGKMCCDKPMFHDDYDESDESDEE